MSEVYDLILRLLLKERRALEISVLIELDEKKLTIIKNKLKILPRGKKSSRKIENCVWPQN